MNVQTFDALVTIAIVIFAVSATLALCAYSDRRNGVAAKRKRYESARAKRRNKVRVLKRANFAK